MNIEYINMKDGSSIVTNEKGEIKKNDFIVSENDLMIENKIETIENKIKKIKAELKALDEDEINNKRILKILPIAVIITAAIITGLFTGIAAIISLEKIIYGLAAGATLGGISSSIYLVLLSSIILSVQKNNNNTIKKLEIELNEAIKLKENYEKELNNAKRNSKNIEINDRTISLKKRNSIELPKVEEEINRNTENTIEEQKKLVLKKKGQY